MFGRGTWAIFGLGKESFDPFIKNLYDQTAMLAASQLAASAVTRATAVDTMGINPFHGPRLDDEHPVGAEHEAALAKYAALDPEERASHVLPAEILDCAGYGVTEEQFRLHATMPWYGMWAVLNEWKDVSDLASIREQRSYRMLDRPYKFLESTDKKTVDQDTLGTTAAVRKQVPVLLDFNDGLIYIESSNKDLIYQVTVRLRLLGVDVVPVAWTFPGRANWPAEILNRLYEKTLFQTEFQKRADEASRFAKSEIEKHEDRELESIVARFFSMTELPSGLWLGISGPAQIRLHDASAPIAAKGPTTATTLLNVTNGAKVLSGALMFQEVVSATSKKGGEYTFRKDIFCVDLNDKINMTEIGAAMVRGFNLSSFRKDVLREIRYTKQVPSIDQFWSNWLHEMSNAVRAIEGTFREVLDIDGDQPAGILPMQVKGKEEVLLEG
jgi:hypothetical protein